LIINPAVAYYFGALQQAHVQLALVGRHLVQIAVVLLCYHGRRPSYMASTALHRIYTIELATCVHQLRGQHFLLSAVWFEVCCNSLHLRKLLSTRYIIMTLYKPTCIALLFLLIPFILWRRSA